MYINDTKSLNYKRFTIGDNLTYRINKDYMNEKPFFIVKGIWGKDKEIWDFDSIQDIQFSSKKGELKVSFKTSSEEFEKLFFIAGKDYLSEKQIEKYKGSLMRLCKFFIFHRRNMEYKPEEWKFKEEGKEDAENN